MYVQVMNAKMGTLADLVKPGYIFEPKLDGYRALCFVNGTLRFISRNQNDLTSKYTELNFRQNIKAKSAILDGEIVAYDSFGHPSFSLLQQGYMASYVVFDILMKDGISLIDTPLIERKKIVAETVIDGDHNEKIFFTQHGQALWQEMVKRKLEGVVAKGEQSHYYPGERSGVWLKIKLVSSIDCVIIGYLKGKRIISSLALGLYDAQGAMTYIGSVGTGFKESSLELLTQKLVPLHSQQYSIKNSEKARRGMQWVQPQLAAEIRYHEMTPLGILRAPVFVRLREDKEARECTFANQL